jgi:hypothetical protein
VLDPGTDLQWAAPVVDGGQVLVADTLSHEGSAPASHLQALDAATGERRWTADLHAPTPGFFTQGPVVAGGLVYLRAASGMLLAVEARSGREVWRDQGESPAIAGIRGGLVIALLDDRLVGFDAAGGGARLRRRPERAGRGRPDLRAGGLAQRPPAAGDRPPGHLGPVVVVTGDGTLRGFAP